MANHNKDCDEINDSDAILQTIGKLYMSNDHADVTFLVENDRIPAHKTIVSARCPYFDSLLNGSFVESSQSEIELHVPLVAFKEILRYIYTGRVLFAGLDIAEILDVCRLADLYGFEPIKCGVVAYLTANISMGTCCEIVDWATKYSIQAVQQVCFEFMERHAQCLLNEESFKTLSITSLTTLLERTTFCAPEIAIFNAVNKWHAHNRDADVKELIRQIRWSLISTYDLCTIVFPSEILEQSELIKIIAEQKEANVKGDRSNPYDQCSLPSAIEIRPDGNEVTNSGDYRRFLSEAKRLKRLADAATHGLAQAILYLESVVQFSFIGLTMERNSSGRKPAFTIYKNTLELLKYATAKTVFQHRTNPQGNLCSKLHALCLRCQSVICRKIFKLQYHDMTQVQPSIESFLDGNITAFPSSTRRSTNSPMATVSVPMKVLTAVKYHFLFVNYLTKSLDQWEQANVAIVSGNNQDWFKQLDEEIGSITVESPFRQSVEYVRAAILKIKSRT